MQEQTKQDSPGPMLTAAVLALAAMTIMANATIASSLPGLRAHFQDVPGIETLAGLIVTLPSIAVVLAAGPVGWMADRFDRQKILIASALLYAIGGTAGLWAEDLTVILVGRLLLGLGVAGTMTLAMTWAADLWQGEARARYLGRQGAAISAGGILFMLAGGALAMLSWRGAFAIYAVVLPVAAFALVLLAPHARRIRAARAATGPVRAEAGADAAFPWSAYAVVAPLAFLFMTAFYLTPTRLPFLLEDLGVTNTLAVGAIMATLTLVMLPVSLNYGRIRRYVSAEAIFAWSFALMAVALMFHATATDWHGVLIGSVVGGLAMGPSMANYTTWFMARVPPAQRGRASGLLTTAFFLGQFASPLVSAPLVQAFGLQGAFAALALGLALVAVVIAVAMFVRRPVPA